MAKKAQNDKKLSVVPNVSGTIPHMIFIYGTHVKKDKIFRGFVIFPNFNFRDQ